jgi:hypothetical protein
VTTTLMFRLDDVRLRDDEKRKLLALSNDLARRALEKERRPKPTNETSRPHLLRIHRI